MSSGSGAGLPVGAPAPRFSLQGITGETISLDSLLSGGLPVMLIFSDPSCGPCEALMPDIARWQREHVASLRIAIAATGDGERNAFKAHAHGLQWLALQRKREVSEAYRISGTPMAVVINPDGQVRSPTVGGAPAVRRLFLDVTATRHSTDRKVVPWIDGGGDRAAGTGSPDLAAAFNRVSGT